MVTPNPLERDVESKVVKFAVQHGFEALKLNGEGHRGWPDRLFLYNGERTLFIEFKRRGEKPRKLQDYIRTRLQKKGYRVEVVDSSKEGIRILQEILDAAQVPGESGATPGVSRTSRLVPGPRSRKDVDNPGRS